MWFNLFFTAISLVIECFVIRTLYNCHSIHIWYSDRNGYREEIKLFMPSATDLDCKSEDVTVWDIKKYEEQVVFPAKDYFTQVNRLRKIISDDLVGIGLAVIVGIPLLYVCYCLHKFVNHTTVDNITIIVIALAIIPLSLLINHFIEKFNPSFFEFSATEDQLKKDFEDEKKYNKFPVSEKHAYNNYVIQRHSDYINNLEPLIRNNKAVAIIACGVGVVFLCIFVYLMR